MTEQRADLDSLRRRLDGVALGPDDAGWDSARQAWNLAADQRPAAVVYAASVEDVRAAVAFARDAGLAIAAQGTGHGAGSLAPLDGTVLLKTVRMGGVHVDPVQRMARVEAGALWGDVAVHAGEAGLAGRAGSSPDVGVVGYTLGGGIGWLGRRHGLASNSVRAIELVGADAEVRRADHDHDPELFWALRGGGGGLGVVTALEFDLVPLVEVFAGALAWPADRGGEVLDRFRTWAGSVPDELSASLRFLQLPPVPAVPEPLRGRSLVVVDAAFLGGEREGAALMQPLRAIPGALLDTFATMPARDLARLHGDPEQPTAGIGDGFVLGKLGSAAAAAFLAAAGPGSGSPLVSAELRQIGGRLAVPSPGHGALGAIDGEFVVYGVGSPDSDESAAAIRTHLRVLADALAPWTSPTSFLNLADCLANTAGAFPAATYRRLRAAKAQYDPQDLFRSNHPIAPLDAAGR